MVSKRKPIMRMVATILTEHLPGKADHELVQLQVSSLRGMLETAISKANDRDRTETQRIINSFLGPIMGICMALEGIADAADTLLQQDPDQGGSMIAELIKSVQARLESVSDEMEACVRS